MTEHRFETNLTFDPKSGTWVEPPPPPCPLGHPPRHIQNGWQPCRIHRPRGHRTIRCEHPEHRTEESRYSYRPPVIEECLAIVYPSAPT